MVSRDYKVGRSSVKPVLVFVHVPQGFWYPFVTWLVPSYFGFQLTNKFIAICVSLSVRICWKVPIKSLRNSRGLCFNCECYCWPPFLHFAEAIQAILIYSQSAEELLKRRKVYREIIFKYLSVQGIAVPPSSEKHQLIACVRQYWGGKLTSCVSESGDRTTRAEVSATFWKTSGYRTKNTNALMEVQSEVFCMYWRRCWISFFSLLFCSN